MKEKLQSALKEAIKARNKVRLDTIRSVLSALQYEAMEQGVEDVSDEQCLVVLRRELKKRREEVEFAAQAHRSDLNERLSAEIATLEEFLPQQLTSADIEKILSELKAASPGTNMGGAMKHLKESYPGQFDGKLASELAKKHFG